MALEVEVEETGYTCGQTSGAGGSPKGSSGPSSPRECFLCCESVERGPLVSGVCHCRTLMHVKCQQRMLDAMLQSRLEREGEAGDPVLRCSVCRAPFTNARTNDIWRLSPVGWMWLAGAFAMLTMLLSSYMILAARLDSLDPEIDLLSPTWWQYQMTHITWWRVVGMLYLSMAVGAVAGSFVWLSLESVQARQEDGSACLLLLQKQYSVSCWVPPEAPRLGGGLDLL